MVISPQIGFIRGGRGKGEELEVLRQKLGKTKTEGEVKITRLLGRSFINTLKEEAKLVANNHLDIVPLLETFE